MRVIWNHIGSFEAIGWTLLSQDWKTQTNDKIIQILGHIDGLVHDGSISC